MALKAVYLEDETLEEVDKFRGEIGDALIAIMGKSELSLPIMWAVLGSIFGVIGTKFEREGVHRDEIINMFVKNMEQGFDNAKEYKRRKIQ